MSYIDVGTGPPLVLVPGIQGRWEYQRPCIDALAKRFRVLSLPLSGERGAEGDLSAAGGLDNDTRQIATILDRSGIDRAAICGVSFGGLVAVRFAAAYQHRVRALVLASTPGPDMHLRRRHERVRSTSWHIRSSLLCRDPIPSSPRTAGVLPAPSRPLAFFDVDARNVRTCSCICQANGGPGDPSFKEQRARRLHEGHRANVDPHG